MSATTHTAAQAQARAVTSPRGLMSTHTTALLRLTAVLTLTGYGKTILYARIKAGTFTRPVRIGARMSGWPAGEVATINQALTAGQADEQLQALVTALHEARAAGARH